MTYPGPLTSRYPASQLAQRLTHQAWETIGLPPHDQGAGHSPGINDDGGDADPTPAADEETNDALQDDELEEIVEQIAAVLECRLAEIVKKRKEGLDDNSAGRSTPTRRLSNEGVVRRRLSNESFDRARRRCSNESHTSVGSAGSNRSNRSATRMRRRHSTSSVDVIYVSPMCRAELRQYVRVIGRRYRPCRYHSFRHAAHVTLSANKLLDLLEERRLAPEEYDCCTYHPETEQIYDNCSSGSSIELDHRFQRELRRLSIASRASSGRRGSNVSGSVGAGAGGGGQRRGSNVSSLSAATGSARRGSNASAGLGLGLGLGMTPTTTWTRRGSLGSQTTIESHGAGYRRRRSSAAGAAAIRRGSLSSIMSVAVSEADIDSVMAPPSDTSSQQRMRRRRTQENIQTKQGVNLRPGELPRRRNSTGSASGSASSQHSADTQEPRISTATGRAVRRHSLGAHSSAASSSAASSSTGAGPGQGPSLEGKGQRRRRHSAHGASHDVQAQQGVNLRPGLQPPRRRNSTGSNCSHASGSASSQHSADAQELRSGPTATGRRAAPRQSLGANSSAASSAAASLAASSAAGPGQGPIPEGRGQRRRRHSVHGASRDVWESCSSHGTEEPADGKTTLADADDTSSHRDTFDADGSFGLMMPDDLDNELKPRPHRSSTFGIATDPLIKFCLVYAGLIHDVDHQGIPNRQLSRENHPLALLYNDKSVAEQNSLKVAFSTLMEPRFAELRHTLCPTSDDQFEFRRIVIDLVMCTDIASPERMQITKSKWAEAFGTRVARPSDDGVMAVSHTPASASTEAIATVTASRPRLVSIRRNSIGTNPTRQYTRRAKDGGKLGIKRALHLKGSTIEFYSTAGDTDDPEAVEVRLRSSTVLELMMNAADVAHTMQSFENFVKWNKRLYEELHEAYESGRCSNGEEDDPSKDWFGNQLGFYEIYILPLARRLRKCGAFAPDAGEAFVQNAKNICRRWEYEGAAITDRMIADVRREYDERMHGRAAAQDAPQGNEVEGKKLSISSNSCGSNQSDPLTSVDIT